MVVFVWCRFEIAAMLVPESLSGGGVERWQVAVCAVDGFSSLDFVRPQCGPLWWRPQGAQPQLRRTVPRHGLCPVDLSRESAGHRSMSQRPAIQALPDGLSFSRAAFHFGRSQREPRLAYLCRVGATADASRSRRVSGLMATR